MEKHVTIAGKSIFYTVSGTGPRVMLLHGFAEYGNVWKNQESFLEVNFQLIIPDLPGSGRSESIEDMSMEGMAEVIKAILDSETGAESTQQKPVLIGHSMGGYVALAFVEKYPDYLGGFGLFHSSAYADSEEKKITRRKGIDFMGSHGAYEFLKTSTPNLFSALTKSENQKLVSDFLDSLKKFSAASLISYYEAMMKRPDRTAVLSSTSLPVLFVMGKYDVAVPISDSLKQCHLPSNSHLFILKKSAHMGMLEEEEKANHILAEFLCYVF